MAAWLNNIDCVKTLIEDYGASINSRSKSNKTPLHTAALSGKLKAVKLLTSYPGCDVDAKDQDGETALDWAREQGHKEVVRFLESLPAAGTAAAVASVTSAMAASNITDDSKEYSE